jgi:predicted DNA-binding transcriptional regulator YafY
MSKLERLLNLTAALLHTGRALTAAEIQQRLGDYPEDQAAFRRAFERDKDDLREMGIPISRLTLERDDGRETEAYLIRKEDYYLRDPGLEPDELAALHLAAAAVRMDGLEGMEALWKLGGDPGDATSGAPVVHLPSDPRLTDLFAAISDQQVIRFHYQGVERELEPHRLGFQRGRWYITGHDRLRDAERNFRLDRIDGPIERGAAGAFASVSPGRALTEEAWEIGDEPAIDARLLVDAGHVAWAAHHLDGDEGREDRPDGSAIFTLRVSNRAAFRSFVFGFLEHAEVLGPADLRAEVIADLADLAGTHRGDR